MVFYAIVLGVVSEKYIFGLYFTNMGIYAGVYFDGFW